jgi:hypothetical protein
MQNPAVLARWIVFIGGYVSGLGGWKRSKEKETGGRRWKDGGWSAQYAVRRKNQKGNKFFQI